MKHGERGQSEVIGVVLLLAITIGAVTVTVATGSAALGLVTDEARSASVENGMSQLSSQSSLVALGETDARRFDLGSVDGGQLRLDESAGRVEVRIENGTDTTVTYNGSIGTLAYVGDRRTVALQGGGVWATEGGRGQMISPPEYHYRGETLTFPIVRLTGAESSPASGTGVVRRTAGNSSAVAETENPLRNGTVVVEVESEYYEGWYDFFVQRADGTVTKDDANRTATARLVVPEEVSFDRAITLEGEYTHKSNNNGLSESKYTEQAVHRSPASMIESNLQDSADSSNLSNCFDSGSACTSGTYYASGDVAVDERVEFDTSDGDIEIAVDGDLDLGGNELEIANEGDGVVRYYVNGSVFANGDATVGTTGASIEARRNQFYVREGFLEDGPGQGNVDIDAVVYAPNSDTDLAGNVRLRGGFVFNSLATRSNAFTIEQDEALEDIEIRITGGPGQNPLTYLHVSENVVEIDFDR
jgi:flagellin-like protein